MSFPAHSSLLRILAIVVSLGLLGSTVLTSAASAQGTVVLSEAVARNDDGIEDAYGSTSDWIEIHNPGQASVSLAGWGLSDNPALPLQWVFPNNTSLGAGDYLIVFASGEASIGNELHAPFSLSSTGETITLADSDGSIVSTLNMTEVPPDYSYGVTTAGTVQIYSNPTPGAANDSSGSFGVLADPVVTPGRGLYTAPIQVTITHPDPAATIRYSFGSSAPTSASEGQAYSGPFTISEASVIRVAVFRNGYESPEPVTHTFVFASQEPAGVPTLPVIALVTTANINFSTAPRTAVSVEWIDPEGGPGFQVDAAAAAVGNPVKNRAKQSWRLYFDSEWGESKLDFPVFDGFASDAGIPAVDSFKRLTLRMGSDDSVFFNAGGGRPFDHRQTYLKGRWGDETMLELGHVDTHGRWVNVYQNGEYWGLYHLREHFDDHFMASYFGGDNSNYVGLNAGRVANGNDDEKSWAAASGPAAAKWSTWSTHIDPVRYVDWMLLQEYQGNFWDLRVNGNFRGAGPATPQGHPGFIFHGSDQDITLTAPGDTTIFPGPANSWNAMRSERDPEFLILLNDRIQELLRGDGELTVAAATERWDRLASQIQASIPGEAQRWSQSSFAGVWQSDTAYVRNTVLPARTSFVLNRLASLISSIQAPVITADTVEFGSLLPVSNPNGGGSVYVTTDGSDPRLVGGAVSGSAILASNVVVDRVLTVNGRIRQGNDWGPIVSAQVSPVSDPGAPQVETSRDLVTVAGFGVAHKIEALDAEGDAITFSATGLPAGTSIDAATGIISGTPDSVGNADVVVTVSDGAKAASMVFNWDVVTHGGPAEVAVVLNEYNAVKGSEVLDDDGTDTTFGTVEGNGGDWIELLTTTDVDLRGWQVELWNRENGPLELTDTITFSNNALLADIAAGTIITIAESQAEDLSYDPDDGDFTINARSATSHTSPLLANVAGNFDSNRHDFRIRVRDSAGISQSPFMGETETLRSFLNVSGNEVFARCEAPTPEQNPGLADVQDVTTSTYGHPNTCGDASQYLDRLRGLAPPGDVNCDTQLTLLDALMLAQHLAGDSAPGDCPLGGGSSSINLTYADTNNDNTINTADVQTILNCLADPITCDAG